MFRCLNEVRKRKTEKSQCELMFVSRTHIFNLNIGFNFETSTSEMAFCNLFLGLALLFAKDGEEWDRDYHTIVMPFYSIFFSVAQQKISLKKLENFLIVILRDGGSSVDFQCIFLFFWFISLDWIGWN